MARFVGTVVKQRSVLWAVLAALVVGAGALVVGLGGGDGDGGGDASPPQLPLAAGGGGAGDAQAEAAADATSLRLASVYVPGDDLPDGGGEAPAYRLGGEVTVDDVRALAEALGIDGEPTETAASDPNGATGASWHVDDGETALDVYGPEGSWSAYRMAGDPMANPAARDAAAAAEGTASGSGGAAAPQNLVGQTCPGTAPGADNVVSLCEPPLCPTGPAADPAPGCEPICLDQPDVASDAPRCEPPCPGYTTDGDDPCVPPHCPGDPAADVGSCGPTPGTPSPANPPPTDPANPPETVPPAPPADLPDEEEARGIALDLVAATGADVDGAEVTAENLVSMWSITVEPRLGDHPAPGLAMYVGVGDEGRIESAAGLLAEPDELGDYPLIDTRAAIDRLNEGWGFLAQSAAAAEIAGGVPPETASAPGGGDEMTFDPVPPTDAADPDTPVASDQPAETPAVGTPAVEPTEVEVTDAEVVLVTVPSWDGSGTYLVPGYRFTAADDSLPTVPAVTDDVLEPPPSSPAGEPEPAPAAAGNASPGDPGAAGDRVEAVLYHCGFQDLRHDDRRWVVEDPPFDETNAPPEFIGKGSFVVDESEDSGESGASAVYTDDSGIAVTFTAVGEDWEPPPCD